MIHNPHSDPFQEKQQQGARQMLWGQLQKEMPMMVAAVEAECSKFKKRMKLLYKLGPTDAFTGYHAFVEDYANFRLMVASLMTRLNEFEGGYLKWMSEIKGKEEVIEKMKEWNQISKSILEGDQNEQRIIR